MAAPATRTAAAGMKLCAEPMLEATANTEERGEGEAAYRVEVGSSGEEGAWMYSRGTVGDDGQGAATDVV